MIWVRSNFLQGMLLSNKNQTKQYISNSKYNISLSFSHHLFRSKRGAQEDLENYPEGSSTPCLYPSNPLVFPSRKNIPIRYTLIFNTNKEIQTRTINIVPAMILTIVQGNLFGKLHSEPTEFCFPNVTCNDICWYSPCYSWWHRLLCSRTLCNSKTYWKKTF